MTNVIQWGNPALKYLDFSSSFTAENKELISQGIRASKDGEFEIHTAEGQVLLFTHYKDTPGEGGLPFSSEYEVVPGPGIDHKLALLIYYTR